MLFAQKIAKNEIGMNEWEILFSAYSIPFYIFNFAIYCFLEEQQSFWT